MKRLAILCGVMALLSAAPAQAQRDEPPPLLAEEPALPLLQQAAASPDPSGRLTLLDRALAILVQPTAFRGSVLCARAETLQRLERLDEARNGLDQCRQLRPEDPRVLVVIAVDEMRLKRPVSAAQLFVRAASIDPHVFDTLDREVINSVLRQLAYLRADKVADTLIDALVQAGFGRANPATFSSLAQNAMQRRLKDGEVAGARALLPSIITPEAGLEMLIDRQFEPLWPEIEQWAGSDLSVQRQVLLSGARAAFLQERSTAARRAYANAMVATGHRTEAIALIDEWLDGHVETSDDDVWERNMAIVQQARWLAESGRRAEAIKRMRAAIRPAGLADPDSGQSNIVPNLVVQQLLAHDYTGAKATLDQFTPSDATLESPATAGYFMALRACVAQGLGKHDDAVALFRKVRTLYATNVGAVGYAVDCAGSPDEQARVWIDLARDSTHRSGALLALATARYRLAKALPSRSLDEDMLRTIAQREDVRQTYDALARALPTSYELAFDNFNTAPPPRASDLGPLA